jgi:hypothetical protein
VYRQEPVGESGDNTAGRQKSNSIAPRQQTNAVSGRVVKQKVEGESSLIAPVEAPESSTEPVMDQDEKPAADAEVLNKNPSLAIIDEIMQPFIQSVFSGLEPEAPSSLSRPEVVADPGPASTEPISSLRPQPLHSEISKKAEPETIAPARIQSLRPQPEAPVTPVKPAAKRTAASTESDQPAVQKNQPLDQRPSQKVIIERQQKVFVAGGSSQAASDSKSASSGSPHIGIGQL